jgi:Ni/Co efflux regulator RcnB
MTRTWTYGRATVALGFLALAITLAPPAQADKPSWAGGGKKAEKAEKSTRQGAAARFDEQQRIRIRAYFGAESRAGRCPPGLARKNNGCLPPGQAKKWQLGRPLPRDVVFHDLPPRLVVDLGAPPSGTRYIRVAEDILLIAVGTGMVMDAVKDIARTLER